MSWYDLQVTPEEMTDDEGDASISQVETADFGDNSTASGESKRNGHGGRKSNGAEVSDSIIYPSFICSSIIYHLFIIHLSFIHISISIYFLFISIFILL